MPRPRKLEDRVRGPYWHSAMKMWGVEVVRPGRRRRHFSYKSKDAADAAAAMAPAELLATATRRREHRKTRGETVYFVRVEDGPIKIGRARDVAARLRDLQQAHWAPLRLLATSDRINEKATHHRFAHLRIRGEWFTAASDLLAYVDEISSVVSSVDTPKLVGP